jgi:hypothetical protein
MLPALAADGSVGATRQILGSTTGADTELSRTNLSQSDSGLPDLDVEFELKGLATVPQGRHARPRGARVPESCLLALASGA